MKSKNQRSINNESLSKKPIDVMIAKIGLVGTITVALLGLIGTGITAYLSFLGIQTQIEKPLIATQTAEARAMVNATQTIIQRNISEYSVVYPSCNCDEYLMPSDKVLIRLRWGAKTAELAEQGADFINYVVTIEGQDIGDIQNYRRPAILVKDPVFEGDPNDAWWVYWDIPVGTLSGYSSNIIEAKLELLAGINTGWDVLPVGLEETYRIILHTSIPATPTLPPQKP